MNNGALVPVERKPDHDNVRILTVRGTAICLCGGLMSIITPAISCVLMSFGMSLLGREPLGRRGVASGLVACVFAAVGGALLLGNPTVIVSALIACAMSCASAYLASIRKLDATRMVVLAAIFGLAMVLGDLVLSRIQGTTVESILGDYYDSSIKDMMSNADIESRMLLRQARELYITYWPTMYFATAILMTVLARCGARIGVGVWDTGSGLSSLAIPRWAVMALAVFLAVDLVATRVIADTPHVIVVMGANLVSCARIVLAAQGLGVLLWFLENHNAGRATKVASGVLAALLEIMFAVMSVVGLVDTAVDFRRRKRESMDSQDEIG